MKKLCVPATELPDRCPTCRRKLPKNRQKEQHLQSIDFLRKHRYLWEGKPIERYSPMQCSFTWDLLCYALKRERIYKPSYCNWDMKVDLFVKEIRRKDG